MDSTAETSNAEYLDTLNPQQRDAVLYMGGPQLVIAGAGSGKTRVLTTKILHLLRQGYEPWRILALTFTNKAAREMRERIALMVGERTASKLWMGTFHSIFYRILRNNATLIGFPPGFTIYDAADARNAVKLVIRDMGLDDKTYKPATVANTISWAKNALISPRAYAADKELQAYDERAKRPLTYEIYRIYCERLRAAGVMDFDDLLYFTNVLLRDHPEVLRHYQEMFRYILVDEYQDTNFAQHLIVTQLAGPQGSVMMVGDDAQSIYSFRGANIRNILDLKKSFPTLAEFKLERNYRSTQNIIDCAGSLIEKNTMQMPKKVFSEQERGARVEVAQSYSDFEEAFLVANRIAQVRMSSPSGYDSFAILYRTNAQSRILEESLRKRNIPYRIYGGLSFYQRKEVKDAVAYFRLAVNPADEEALRRIINFPARSIGETTVNKLAACALSNHTSIWEVITRAEELGLQVNKSTLTKLRDFQAMIARFAAQAKEVDAYTLAEEIMRQTGLIAAYQSDSVPENISKKENLQELLAGAKAFVEERSEMAAETPDESDAIAPLSMAAFLQEVSLATDQDATDAAEEAEGAPVERVTLMTMHAAKGLEFDNVFIVGVEEDFLPNSLCQNSLEDIEEERRLLYVAITRARRFCMMSYALSRFRNGQTAMTRPSRFLADINPQYLRAAAGTKLPGTPSRGRMTNPVANYAASRSATKPATAHTSSPITHTSNLSSLSSSSPTPPISSAAASATTHTAAEVKAGMRIEHNRFGEGTITGVDTVTGDPRITVDFDHTGSKTLLLRFAHFNIL